ncbi:MAG TPA: aminotransferase class I/II-fold pyridoxal phosphate-dependent enzyme [Anaerolineales bacterium]|jgi:glycine C-acetyltransferase|nr:aminotransferase class I/II-fold pyridoxal phosphate-dependent enzyme [Anaerolineales bacterium]
MTDTAENGIQARIRAMDERVQGLRDNDMYFYNMPVSELKGSAEVVIDGRTMLMLASYGYLGLLGHAHINAAAAEALQKYGSGTHGVRLLAGTLDLHLELERTIAEFKHAEDAVTFSSGYVTNLAAISTLVGRHDVVFCDKYDHASIVDGCRLSGAELKRFRHNDMEHLETLLRRHADRATKLVIVDAVFSMDGDIIDLPRTAEICRKYGAQLMMDEAHSVGVLGESGRGVEEHFGMQDCVDVKMGTLSKTIPSVGGYIAGSRGLINLMKHAARGFIFSAAIPPAQAAAAKAAFEVLLDEPERVGRVQRNAAQFMDGLKRAGFDTMQSETAIVPVLCGSDEKAYELVRLCQCEDIFVLPVVSPAVPEGMARLRATVTAGHTAAQIERAVDVLQKAGKQVGLI